MSSIWNMGTINCCVINNNRGHIAYVLLLAAVIGIQMAIMSNSSKNDKSLKKHTDNNNSI